MQYEYKVNGETFFPKDRSVDAAVLLRATFAEKAIRQDPDKPEVMVRRRFASEPNNASVHPERDEIYQVMDGSGTLMTGGTFVDPQDRPAGIRGGEERQIGPGDFIVIPAGVPHWFSRIDGSITYVNTRLAPASP